MVVYVIKSDIENKMENKKGEAEMRIRKCKQEYNQMCRGKENLSLSFQKLCEEKEKCMHENPEEVN